MNKNNIEKQAPIEHLEAITPDEIDKLVSGGKIENLSGQFDKVLNDVVNLSGLNPNELMFLDKDAKNKLENLDKEAKKATDEAKKAVANILAEEEIPTVTMTDKEVEAMQVPKEKEEEIPTVTMTDKEVAAMTKMPEKISDEEKKSLIKELKKQTSEVLGELNKLNVQEKAINKEKINLIKELNKTKNIKERNNIQKKLNQIQYNLIELKRRKDNILKMKKIYEDQLSKLK